LAHLENIQAAFLSYLGTTSGTGGTRPAAIAAIQSGAGASNAQATGAVNAVQQAAFDMGAASGTTYAAFAARFAELGAVRGLTMADAACDRARAEYLQTNVLEAKLEHVQEALAGVTSQQGFVASTWATVSGVQGLSQVNRTVLDRLFVLGGRHLAAQRLGLEQEEARLLEQLG
jgi:hypothetical protein